MVTVRSREGLVPRGRLDLHLLPRLRSIYHNHYLSRPLLDISP